MGARDRSLRQRRIGWVSGEVQAHPTHALKQLSVYREHACELSQSPDKKPVGLLRQPARRPRIDDAAGLKAPIGHNAFGDAKERLERRVPRTGAGADQLLECLGRRGRKIGRVGFRGRIDRTLALGFGRRCHPFEVAGHQRRGEDDVMVGLANEQGRLPLPLRGWKSHQHHGDAVCLSEEAASRRSSSPLNRIATSTARCVERFSRSMMISPSTPFWPLPVTRPRRSFTFGSDPIATCSGVGTPLRAPSGPSGHRGRTSARHRRPDRAL